MILLLWLLLCDNVDIVHFVPIGFIREYYIIKFNAQSVIIVLIGLLNNAHFSARLDQFKNDGWIICNKRPMNFSLFFIINTKRYWLL